MGKLRHRWLCAGLAAGAALFAGASAVQAGDDDDGWRKHRHRHYQPYYYGPYYYKPPKVRYYAPPVVYGPPPVMYAPPPPVYYAPPAYYGPPPGLSLGINVPLR